MNISLYLVAALGSGKADLLHACDVCCSGSGGFFIELDLSLLRRELAGGSVHECERSQSEMPASAAM